MGTITELLGLLQTPALVLVLGIGIWNAIAIKRLDAKIDRVEERLNARMDRLDAKIDRVEERLNAKIDQVEERLNARIDQVEERLDAKMDRMEERLNARIDRMEFHSKLADSVLVKEHRMHSQAYMSFWHEPPLAVDPMVMVETEAASLGVHRTPVHEAAS